MILVEENFYPEIDGPKIWWDQLKNGERKGLELIYSTYIDEMYRYGMAIKGNRSFIKDCIQEVFVSLWKYRSGLKQTDNVKLYLFKCLSNNIHREVAVELAKLHPENVEEFDQLFAVNSFEHDWIRNQGNEMTQKKLRSAIEKLPLRQKEVIQLIFFENVSYEGIASIMRLRIKSVYNLAWKAIGTLRKGMA